MAITRPNSSAALPARGRPWKTVDKIELATLSWDHWHNNDRLHCYLNDVPPVESEETFLRYEAGRPNPGRNLTARTSIRPSAIQFAAHDFSCRMASPSTRHASSPCGGCQPIVVSQDTAWP